MTELEGGFEQGGKTGSDAGENHKLETQSYNQTLPVDGVWLVLKKTCVVSLSVLSTVNRQWIYSDQTKMMMPSDRSLAQLSNPVLLVRAGCL